MAYHRVRAVMRAAPASAKRRCLYHVERGPGCTPAGPEGNDPFAAVRQLADDRHHVSQCDPIHGRRASHASPRPDLQLEPVSRDQP